MIHLMNHQMKTTIFLSSVLASYNVPIPTPPQTVLSDEDIPIPARTGLGDEVIRDNALIRIPGAQRYLTPPRTNLALVRP